MEGWAKIRPPGSEARPQKGGGEKLPPVFAGNNIYSSKEVNRDYNKHLGCRPWFAVKIRKKVKAGPWHWENFTVSHIILLHPAPLFKGVTQSYYRKGPKASIQLYPKGQRLGKSSPVLGAAQRGGIKSSSEISAGKLLGRKTQLSHSCVIHEKREANTEMQWKNKERWNKCNFKKLSANHRYSHNHVPLHYPGTEQFQGCLHAGQGWADFFCNGPNNIFDLMNNLVSVTTTQLCHYSQVLR